MTTDGPEAYRLGRDYTVMPIPMDPAHCHEIAAGPLVLVIESRRLGADDVRRHADATGQLDEIDDVDGLDDGGVSVHVLDASDGLEHLRFDCFDHQPHYHYIRHAEGTNTVVRFDDVADGDPLAWVIGRLRRRLPEMLSYVGRDDLARRVSADPIVVSGAVDTLDAVLSTMIDRP